MRIAYIERTVWHCDGCHYNKVANADAIWLPKHWVNGKKRDEHYCHADCQLANGL